MSKYVEQEINEEIEFRSLRGKELALRFPELKGLSYEEFLQKCPIELDFVTSCEMHESLK